MILQSSVKCFTLMNQASYTLASSKSAQFFSYCYSLKHTYKNIFKNKVNKRRAYSGFNHTESSPLASVYITGMCFNFNSCYFTRPVSWALNSIFPKKIITFGRAKGCVVIAPKLLSCRGYFGKDPVACFSCHLINHIQNQFLNSFLVTTQRKIYLSLIVGILAIVCLGRPIRTKSRYDVLTSV